MVIFSRTFDVALMIIFAVLTVVFFIGKGEPVLKAFGQRDNSMWVKKKNPPEYKLAYQKVMGAFCAVLTVMEALLVYAGESNTKVLIVSLVIAIVDVVVTIIVLKKKFPNGY